MTNCSTQEDIEFELTKIYECVKNGDEASAKAHFDHLTDILPFEIAFDSESILRKLLSDANWVKANRNTKPKYGFQDFTDEDMTKMVFQI